MAQLTINYTATADLKAFSTWCTTNVNQSASTWDSTTQEGTLVLNDGVTTLGQYAFQYCTALLSIEIPEGITSIEKWAFYNCTNLTSIIFNESLINIGENAFQGCSGLRGTLVFPNSLTTIGQNAFLSDGNISGVSFGNSLVSIGNSAFSSCNQLTGSVTFPNSLTTIGQNAFSSCNLTGNLVISASVTTIGSAAFGGCVFDSISVDSNNTNYDSRDNCNCIIQKSNNSIIAGCNNSFIHSSVTTIGSSAFRKCTGLTSLESSSVTTIEGFAFNGCSGLTTLNFPLVSSIGRYAFQGCSGLTALNFPLITTIEERTFDGCSGLTALNFPLVTTIGNNSFMGCSHVTSINFPIVTTIGDAAFHNCSSLTSITLPSTVTSIGSMVFSYAFLNSVTCLATTPPTLGAYNFPSNNDTLYIPVASKSAYQSASQWSTAFTNYVGLCEVTSTITGSGSVSPSSVTVPEGESVTITITPAEGYGIFSVTDDGISVPVTHTGMTYTISNIAADHTIAAVFKPYFDINIQVTEGGSLSFPDMAFAGEDFTITATPNEGFDVREFVVDGTDLGRSVYSYTFQAVDSNHSVEVVFSPIYNITVESTEGGTIEGPSIALGGDDVTFTITPDEGMLIFNVLDNDVPIAVNPLGMTYTIPNIQENHTIEVIFAIAKSYGFDLSNLTDDDYIIQIYEEKKNL